MAGQAKTLCEDEVKACWGMIRSRHMRRDRVVFLLTMRAGLRSCEVGRIKWRSVMRANAELDRVLTLDKSVSKGGYGARVIPLRDDLRLALKDHYEHLRGEARSPHAYIVGSQQGEALGAKSIQNMLAIVFKDAHLVGASSHSGRRTFITRAARMVPHAGGSLRDVQVLAGHRRLSSTQGYIEVDTPVHQRLITMI